MVRYYEMNVEQTVEFAHKLLAAAQRVGAACAATGNRDVYEYVNAMVEDTNFKIRVSVSQESQE